MSRTTSPAAQDYLKALCLLEWGAEGIAGRRTLPTTKAVAGRLGVSGASATNMLKRLAGIGLVRHIPFKGVTLTPSGRAIAVEVIRHHRLLETYLAEALGVPWDRVHDEAEVLEHVLSEDLEDRMAAVLGEPTSDPHGHPIPARSGEVAAPAAVPLTELEPGRSATVLQVSDHDPELLRYLDELGLRPGVEVVGVGAEPFQGTVTVRLGASRRALGRTAAEHVLVEAGQREHSASNAGGAL